MIALALPIAFTSCGDDDDKNLTLDKNEVTLNYGTTQEIKASEKNCTWTSSNEFVATVSDGKIEAQHAGQAVITVTSKDGAIAKCNVTVNPTNNNFIMPVTNWGASINTIKGEALYDGLVLVKETTDALVYMTRNTYPYYGYTFNQEGLESSSLTVSEAMDEELNLNEYLEQRYNDVSSDDDEYLIYVNANSLTNATIAVQYGYDPTTSEVIAAWTPVTHVKSGVGIDNSIISKHRDLIKQIRK